MRQCNLSRVAARFVLASTVTALACASAMAAHRDIAPLPAEVIDAVMNQATHPKAVLAEQFSQVANQMVGALSRHAGPQPKLSGPQVSAYLTAAKADIAAQRANLASIKPEVAKAFKARAGLQAAMRELDLLDAALAKAGNENKVEALRAQVGRALDLLVRYNQANDQEQALKAPGHPTMSALTPYTLSPLPVAQKDPQYVRNGDGGQRGVVQALAGNAILLPTPTEASSCSYTAADLGKTQEEVNSVKYPELAALAKSLDYSPVKIFEYVYNNVGYRYNYFGSLKGAYGTYLTKEGNNFDQASLLIALLRASNIPARYVFGNVEITDAAPAGANGRVNRWLGTKSYVASQIVHQFASGGVPTMVNNTSGQPVGFRTLHVWVQACVPYASYRGSALTNRGHRWIPLDASFKDINYQPGIVNSVGFDLNAFLAKRTNGPDSLPHEKFLKDIEANTRSTNPGKGLSDVPYKGKTTAIPFDILPATLPYKVQSFIDVGGGVSDPANMPDKFRQTLKMVVSNPAGTVLTERSVPLVEGLFKRMTLSFKGADATNQGRIDTWRNNASMDSPEPSCAPSTSTRVVPSIKFDGAEVAAGASASSLDFCVNNARLALYVSVPHLTCQGPSGVTSDGCVNRTQFTNIEGSNLYAILAYGDHASTEYLQKRINRLQSSIRSALTAPNGNSDEIEGEFLNIVAQKFGHYVNDASDKIAKYTSRSIGLTGIHLGVTKAKSKISYVFDQPFALNRKGFVIDVPGGQNNYVNSSTGAFQLDLFFLSGRSLSSLESYVWQENAKTDAVSTMRGLQFANETGNPVITLNSANWATESTKLVYTAAEIAQFKAQVDQGATVYTSKTKITYDNWTGIVYISENGTGSPSAGYAISGGYSGGYTTTNPVNYNYNSILNTGYSYVQPPALPTFNSVISTYTPPPPVLNSQINYGSTLGNTYSGDPVNMVTGNMYHSETDVDITLRGGNRLVFQRAYNSRKSVDGPLGYGWTHSFNQFLTFRDDNVNSATDAADTDGVTSSVTWTDGSGAEKYVAITSGTSGTGVAATAVFKAPDGNYFSLKKNADNTYTLTDKGGIVYNFEAAAGTKDQRANLVNIKDRNSNTITLNYDASKRLSNATDGTRTLTFAYEGASTRIKEVTDWLSRKHTYLYDASGNLEKVFKPGVSTAGTPSMSYSYHTTADGPNLDHAMKRFTLARGNFMEFTYYPNGRVLRHTNAQGETMSFSYNDFRRETVQVNERGHERRFFFDKNGMPLKTIEENLGSREFTFGAADAAERFNLKESIDPRGAKSSYTHDAATGNLLTTTYPSGRTEVRSHYNTLGQPGKLKDVRGLYTLFKYDAKGNVLEQIRLKSGFGATATPATYAPVPADAKAQIMAWTINTYDAFGNLLTSKQVSNMETKAGPSVEYAYEATNTYRNKVTRKGDKNGDGAIAADEFDTATLVPDAAGQTKTAIDGRWEVVTYDYDEQGRVKTVTNAAGVTSRIEYDANGNVKLQKLEATVASAVRQLQSSSFEYDLADRKVRSTGLGLTAAFEYDAAGNLISQVDPDGRTLSYVYDEMNRLTSASDKEGNRVSKTLDIDGRALSVTDANGLTTTYTYWDASRDFRVKRVTQPKSAAFANGRSVEYDYDEAGNTKSVKVFPADGAAARETLTTFDELSRPVRVVGPVVNDPVNGNIRRVTKYTYDNLGRLTVVNAGRTDVTGISAAADTVTLQASYTYDDFGRKLKDLDGAGRAWIYTYNAAGDVLTVTDPRGKQTTQQWLVGGYLQQRQNEVGTVTFTRDVLGLPTRVTNNNPAYTQDFTYSPQRRLQSVRDSRGGKSLYYEYSKAGQLNAMRDSEGGETNYLYDPAGRLMGLWAANYDYIAFGYDKGGRLAERWSPNGVKAEMAYNDDGSLSSIRHVVAGAEKAKHSYLYDAWGNRKEHAENLAGTELKYGYEYDELNRLVKAQYTQGTTTALLGQYRYDILNNRTRTTDASGSYLSYLYDTVGGAPANVGAQQLNQIDLYNAQNIKQSTVGTFSYDVAGNLTGKSVSGTVQSLAWDANNDLRQVNSAVTSGAVTTNYSEVYDYDHEGRRITRQMLTNGTLYSSLYWYNGEDIHKEYGLQWVSPAAAYTHGPAQDEPLIYQSAAGSKYYHADGLGSPTLLTDAAGNLQAFKRFDPWGRVIGSGGAMPTYGFTGREPDLSTGYTYYRARYYDSALGRFLSRDPIGLQGGLNVYAYVDNNPVNNTDPDGLYARNITNAISGVGSAVSNYYDTTVSSAKTFASNLDPLGTLDQFGRKLAYNFVENNKPGSTAGLWTNNWLANQVAPYASGYSGNTANGQLAGGLATATNIGASLIGGGGFNLLGSAKGASRSLDELSQAAMAADRGGLTSAGRALQKHGGREGSAFPGVTGGPGAINKQGQFVVDDILTSPGSTNVTRNHARFGEVTEIRAPDGRGVRYGPDGKFIGFLEP